MFKTNFKIEAVLRYVDPYRKHIQRYLIVLPNWIESCPVLDNIV